jgi:uncharacterized protein (TIGR03437 family)
LSASATGNSVAFGDENAPSLTVNVNPAGLAPGEYFGQVRLTSDNAINSPQIIPVMFNVLASTANPGPDVSPTGIVVTGVAGTSPGSQTVQIANLGTSPITYTLTRSSDDGRLWFMAAPVSGTITPGEPGKILIQPDFTTLGEGVRRGTLNLRFSDGSTRLVEILGITSSGAGDSADGKSGERLQSSNCQNLAIQWVDPTQTTDPSRPAEAVLNQQVSMKMKVLDCGGREVREQNATSIVSFSNGDAPEDMKFYPDGNWQGRWTPRREPAPLSDPVKVTVTVVASVGQRIVAQRSDRWVRLRRPGSNPIVARGVRNSATLQESTKVAPGSLITIRGEKLSDAVSEQLGTPVPLEVSGTQVILQGKPLPLLYTSDGQINAQVPYGLDVNSPQQIFVLRNGTTSPEEILQVAPADPGILTKDATGAGQGLIYLDQALSSLAEAGNGAAVGSTVYILCTGLGEVAGRVNAGEEPPDPRAPVMNTVTVEIGGVQAKVIDATLRPGLGVPGGYEVQVTVPEGVTAGDQVPVRVMAGGQSSQVATMAVK